MENENQNLLQGIDTVIIRVSDIENSKNWYQTKLRLVSIWEDPKTKLVVLDSKGPTSLTLWQANKKITVDKETGSYPIFKTPDAAMLRNEFQNNGIEVGELIHDDIVMYFFFFDPDGNILEACQVHD
jgi:catechol-2,3-dioxygenase